MDTKIIWPYYIWMYFDILNDINKKYRKLIKLCDGYNNRKIEKMYYEIMERITQIIPYRYKEQKVKLKKTDGILELASGVKFIEKELESILEKYKDEMISIKIIRNNVEHSPHRVILCSQVSGIGSSNIIINYYERGKNLNNLELEDLISCNCSTLILERIINALNELFKVIRNEIKKLALDGMIDKEMIKHYKKYRLKI